MPNPQTIREYLVSLGWEIKSADWRKFEDTLKLSGQKVEKFALAMAKDFTVAGGVAVTALATVAGATVGIMTSVANQDLRYQLLARRMFMTTEATKKMKMATDALGYSLEEIIWGPPELAERYRALIKDQDRMFRYLGSDGGEKAFRAVRDIEFQFTRMVLALQVLGMKLTTDIIERLTGTHSVDEALRFITAQVDRFENAIPRISAIITGTLVPAIQWAGREAKALYEDLKLDMVWLRGDHKASSLLGQGPFTQLLDKEMAGETPSDAEKKSAWGSLSTSRDWAGTIGEDAARLGIPVGLALAIAQKESGMNPEAPLGSRGEIGMFQLMPDTVTQLQRQHKMGNPNDPDQNIVGGLNWLLEKPGATWAEKVRGYNGSGPAADAYRDDVMRRWRQNSLGDTIWGGGTGDFSPGARLQPQSYKIDITVNGDPTKLKDDIKRAVIEGITYHERVAGQRAFARAQGVS